MTDIAIRLPLPMSVSATLMNLVGAAWPEAELVDNQDGYLTGDRHMVLRILESPARPVSPEEAAEAVVEPGEDDLQLLELGPNGISTSRPEQLSAMMLEIMLAGFNEHPDAENYLENLVRDPETGKQYVLIFARSKGQTPHELRMAAEERLESARADVHREAVQSLLKVKGLGNHPGTFADGVQACLEALREQNFSHID